MQEVPLSGRGRGTFCTLGQADRRRVEAGEEVTITVAGRPSARLVPAGTRQWRSWADLADLFDGPADADWARDRDPVDQQVGDPWAQR